MSNLTILAVAYKPRIELVSRLIENFSQDYPILIINNSLSRINENFYNKKNVEIIDNTSNLGNGAGINLGLKKIKSKYALYLDFDSLIDKQNFKKLCDYAEKLRDFAVLIPNSTNVDEKLEPFKTWEKEGSIMFFNLSKIKNQILFDEKFFLYFEEVDFFFNCLKKNLDVFFIPAVKIFHEQGSSSEKNDTINDLRIWHYSWSQFYFYKKNFGYLKAISKCFPFLIKDSIMMVFYLIILNFKPFKLRYYRINGLLNSMIGLRSWKRKK